MIRKSGFLIALLCVAFFHRGISQTSFSDLFDSDKPLTYLGVDFTQAKVTGHTNIELEDLANRHFSNINNLVLNEPKKYDLPKFFHKSDVASDISFVEEHNKKIDPKELNASGKDKDLTAASIEKLVKGYNFGGKKGMGVLMIVESMKKIEKNEEGTLYVVFVDMATNKVLYSEKFTSKPAGFGLRNYWAKIVYNALDAIGDSKYKEWKKRNQSNKA